MTEHVNANDIASIEIFRFVEITNISISATITLIAGLMTAMAIFIVIIHHLHARHDNDYKTLDKWFTDRQDMNKEDLGLVIIRRHKEVMKCNIRRYYGFTIMSIFAGLILLITYGALLIVYIGKNLIILGMSSLTIVLILSLVPIAIFGAYYNIKIYLHRNYLAKQYKINF